MQTERFNRLRKSILDEIFKKDDIVKVWRKIVRQQLRNLDIKDLYDHYDFNYNIHQRTVAIKNMILNGTYKVGQPLVYRIEKKFGVCRHLVIPQPIDALVLQVLVENIIEGILNNSPSDKAFYSRDKANVQFPHQVGYDYGLTWRKQWKLLQKEIYKFQESKELIVVTDLSNYYDSIDIKELRKVFTSYAQIDEVLVDLLFRILEDISWKPDYLPYSGRGLPTTNIEGVRLMAHSFLFEIDEVLKQKSENSFTRWMDDIIVGTNDKKDAMEIISSISDMLKSRGLALNLSKTNIYNSKQGRYHFQIGQNRYLDKVAKVKKGDHDKKEVVDKLHRKFKLIFDDTSPKYWDKIAKRYITAYMNLGSKKLLKLLSNIYVTYPGLRSHLLMYLSSVGYSKKSSKVVLEIVDNLDVYDDLSLYQLCQLVTVWKIPLNRKATKFINRFEKKIVKHNFKRNLPSDFFCTLWFKAKYNHPEDLLLFIEKFKPLWQKDTFLRRQVTAILSRLLIVNSKKVEDLLINQISSGINDTVTLANQIFTFSEIDNLNKRLTPYLFPEKQGKTYSLPKFLVLCSVLNSEKIRSNKDVRKKVLKTIDDPYYLKWIDAHYNIK